ncbi:ComEC/Rec2 family competence protein [uncultured Alistipes sp.]|uniref:ComEC/Rec2 family competence protein n=1 Tax=uncultured Alistipes sp. TaxID=538949 RepID=UPI0028037C44|nr:ComEC/Rec2 family competence protein [uncultured Alistipes sp.]
MKIACLTDRLDRMPMVKLLAPFAAGIALADCYELPLWFLAGAFVCAGVVALLMRSGAAAGMLLLTAGFAAAQLRTPEADLPQQVPTLFEVVVTGFPVERERYTTADAEAKAWRDPATGRWHPSQSRIRLYTDTLTKLRDGERIRCRGTVRPFRGGAESYRRLMERRGYAGTLWIGERQILERSATNRTTLHRRAVERLHRLGERRGITGELRTAYSRSGMSHLLAVSGLHTGIVFVVVNLLLWWLPLVRRGHLWKNLLAASAVWLFVAAAGFPPSAVRAAVMCTVLQTALASASEYVGMNALATAAFGMLLWNPAWIGDLSFQLSFLAVAGILVWGVPLCRRLRSRRRWLNAVIDAYAIGLTATIATAPLVSHTFGIVPLAGVAVNPVAIALAGVVVFGGALWMLAPVGWLAPLFGAVTGWSAGAINTLARMTASLPGGAGDWRLDTTTTVVLYALMLLATLAAGCREPKKRLPLRRIKTPQRR